MRFLFWFGAALIVVLGTMSTNLWREVRSQRKVVAELRMELGESQDRVAVAEARARNQTTVPLPDNPVASIAKIVTSRLHTDSGNAQRDSGDAQRDAEYRKARLTLLRTAVVQSHPGLAEALGLSGAEADSLVDLLVENQMNRDSQASGEAIRALLGEARYARWQEYLPTRSVRIQADAYANALTQAGAPLNGDQLHGLVAVMLGEQKSLRQDMVALGRSVDPTNPASQAQARDALRNRQAASNQRILDAASPQLNTQQQALLRAQFEQGDAVKQATDRTWERPGAVQLQR